MILGYLHTRYESIVRVYGVSMLSFTSHCIAMKDILHWEMTAYCGMRDIPEFIPYFDIASP
jgi:hypothetical protein